MRCLNAVSYLVIFYCHFIYCYLFDLILPLPRHFSYSDAHCASILCAMWLVMNRDGVFNTKKKKNSEGIKMFSIGQCRRRTKELTIFRISILNLWTLEQHWKYIFVEHWTQIASSWIPMFVTKLKTFWAHIPVDRLFEFKWLFSFIEEIVWEGGTNRKYWIDYDLPRDQIDEERKISKSSFIDHRWIKRSVYTEQFIGFSLEQIVMSVGEWIHVYTTVFFPCETQLIIIMNISKIRGKNNRMMTEQESKTWVPRKRFATQQH